MKLNCKIFLILVLFCINALAAPLQLRRNIENELSELEKLQQQNKLSLIAEIALYESIIFSLENSLNINESIGLNQKTLAVVVPSAFVAVSLASTKMNNKINQILVPTLEQSVWVKKYEQLLLDERRARLFVELMENGTANKVDKFVVQQKLKDILERKAALEIVKPNFSPTTLQKIAKGSKIPLLLGANWMIKLVLLPEAAILFLDSQGTKSYIEQLRSDLERMKTFFWSEFSTQP